MALQKERKKQREHHITPHSATCFILKKHDIGTQYARNKFSQLGNRFLGSLLETRIITITGQKLVLKK